MGLINFTKSQALGNDFIIIEDLDAKLDISVEMIKTVCDRNFGIGADGLILLKNSVVADGKMDFNNADGSVAEMCGNGIRVLAKYIFERLCPEPRLEIETLVGIKQVDITVASGQITSIAVDMGEPVFADNKATVIVSDQENMATCLSMGNPHCVVFVDDVDKVDMEVNGPAIENSELFPDKVNVEFVQVISRARLKVRVWERGVGATLACGTGACAALAAASADGLTGREVVVDLPGGRLSVSWLKNDHINLAGGARQVFTGQINLDNLPTQGEQE